MIFVRLEEPWFNFDFNKIKTMLSMIVRKVMLHIFIRLYCTPFLSDCIALHFYQIVLHSIAVIHVSNNYLRS